jgi:hypothetical protein
MCIRLRQPEYHVAIAEVVRGSRTCMTKLASDSPSSPAACCCCWLLLPPGICFDGLRLCAGMPPGGEPLGPQMPASDTREPAPALPLVDKLLFSAAARGLPFLLALCPMLPRYLLLLLPEGLNVPVDSPRICATQQHTYHSTG